MKNVLIVVLSLVLLSWIGFTAFSPKGKIEAGQSQKAADSSQVKSLVHDYNVYAIELPEKMNFAGEAVPLKNPDIRRRLDRELIINVYWQSNTFRLLKRAHRYFPIIEPILEEEGVPEDFKYLAVAESALKNVISPAGAAGIWQFMPATAREYGLEVNDNIDERYHIQKATRAACAYLKKAKEKFGTWTLAAAAYNAGSYGIEYQQERQKVHDYYDLLLNNQTERYVFRILAIKELLSQPHRYGFNFSEDDLYNQIPVNTIKIDTSVNDFALFAKRMGINYKILKLHNPWLREAHLDNPEGKTYKIDIPKEGYYTYEPKIPDSLKN